MTAFLIGLGIGLVGGPAILYLVKFGYKKLRDKLGLVDKVVVKE